MNKLIVAWQDPISRCWFPVGRLYRLDGTYFFQYTAGAHKSENFVPFSRMRNFNNIYISKDIFPVFSNRVMPASRPDYKTYMNWLDIYNDDPMEILARSQGSKLTDGIQLYPIPDKKEKYELSFFCHGLRYMSPDSISRVNNLENGTRIYPMYDVNNPVDKNAIALRCEDPSQLVGYCPAFLTKDFRYLISNGSAIISVEKVNPEAPPQFRMRCRISADWPAGFTAFDGEDFQPITKTAHP